MTPELVCMEAIAKSYGHVQALRKVDFAVSEKEIVGLVGDNGAGKSTLIKILSGVTCADAGTISIRNKPVVINRTVDAIKLGIETIYQDSALVPQLSIARNLFLGREPTRRLGVVDVLDTAYMRQETRQLMKRAGIKKDLDPDTPVATLSGGERQSIAIARAMFFEASLILLDEPTNNLGVEESNKVMEFVLSAKASGHASILITHNIYHVFQVVDRIVIMRRGEVVGNVLRQNTNIGEVEKVIVGMQAQLYDATHGAAVTTAS